MSNEKSCTDIDKDKLWGYMIKDLATCMPTPSYEMAIRPLGVRSFSNGKLILVTDKAIWKKFLLDRFANDIVRALRKYSQNPDAEFNVIVDKNYVTEYTVEPKKQEIKLEEATQNLLPLNEVQIDSLKFLTSYNLNVKYDFTNFVVSQSNKLAYGASKGVANEPGKLYNPLFLWGGAGLGKTHLVNAIGKHILIKRPDLKLKYITINDFTNEFTRIMFEYKGNPKLKNDFINKYRNVDVLLIDDVQFLEGRSATQDELFTVFDFLHRNGKQIVITSDRPPKDIPTLTDRLRSRFEWGLIAEIKPPEFETRKEILKLKMQENNISLDDDIVELIANSFTKNVRELEGALNKLSGYMSIEETDKLDISTVKELLNLNILKKKLTINDVINIVSEYYKVEPSEIKGSNRGKEIMVPRYVAIYLTRELLKASLPQIGDVFGNRKHATILYAYEKMKQMLDQNPNLKLETEGLSAKIKAEYAC